MCSWISRNTYTFISTLNSDDGLAVIEDQQQQNLSEDSAVEIAPGSGISKNLMNDDEFKASYVKDVSVWFFFITFSSILMYFVCSLVGHAI